MYDCLSPLPPTLILSYNIHAADVGFCDCPDILPPGAPTLPTLVAPQPPPGNLYMCT